MVCPQVQKRTNFGLCLSATAELGLIDSERTEDAHGVDGQLTLHHILTAAEFAITMSEVSDFDAIDHNAFDGVRAAAPMPLGLYEIRGKVQDTMGNTIILTSVDIMFGTEDVQEFCFDLVDHHLGSHIFPVPSPRRIHPVPDRDGSGTGRNRFQVPWAGRDHGGNDAIGNATHLTAKSRVFVPPILED